MTSLVKKHLSKVKAEGASHKLRGVIFGGKPIEWYISDFYHVHADDKLVGYMTSAWYSPAMESNIGFVFVPVKYSELGTKLTVSLPKVYSDTSVEATVMKTPFKKSDSPGSGLLRTGTKL